MAKTMNANSEIITFEAGAGCRTTTAENKVAYLSGNMTVCLASATTDRVVGIISSFNRLSASTEQVGVIVHGLAKGVMQSGTACAYGDWLVADTQGCLDVFVTNTTEQNIVGMAYETPATGGAVTVYVNPSPFGIMG